MKNERKILSCEHESVNDLHKPHDNQLLYCSVNLNPCEFILRDMLMLSWDKEGDES